MGWNKEFRPSADYFPNDEENPIPGGTLTEGGAPICVDLTLASGDADTTMTNQVSGQSDPIPRNLKYDSSAMKYIRVVIDDVKTVGASTSRMIAKYANTKAEALAGTFSHPGIGATEVAASMAALGPSWTDSLIKLDPAAIGDVIWHVFAIGGNGVADPVVSGVHIQFFTGMLDPCAADGGCPMPVETYNGEDFSSYADEAAFLAFVEAETDNRYNVWYGDDGSVEGVSFDPDLTWCGNPVAVGRWKAVSSGSSTWDIIGFGNWTRFSDPTVDTGAGTFPPRVSFTEVWATLRFKIESGWTADDSPGFLISELQSGAGGTNGTYTIYLRDGRVIFRSRADSTLGSYVEYDLGAASLIVGTDGFVEVTLHGRIVPNVSAGLYNFTVEAFVNPACSGGPAGAINTATPLGTYTVTGLAASARPKFFIWDKFNSTSGNAQWPEKKIWVAQWFYSGSLT